MLHVIYLWVNITHLSSMLHIYESMLKKFATETPKKKVLHCKRPLNDKYYFAKNVDKEKESQKKPLNQTYDKNCN